MVVHFRHLLFFVILSWGRNKVVSSGLRARSQRVRKGTIYQQRIRHPRVSTSLTSVVFIGPATHLPKIRVLVLCKPLEMKYRSSSKNTLPTRS